MTTIDEWLEALRVAGDRLAEIAADTDLDAPVPTCPGWTVRDLVRHAGGIHRWARSIVGTPRTEEWDVDLPDLVGEWPADDVLEAWVRQGCEDLVATLAAAPDDLVCYTFLEAASPKAMWARRQAHETTIHRVDGERASGGWSPIPAGLASDGIDELLTCFVTRRPTRSPLDVPATVGVHTTDTSNHWHLTVGGGPIRTVRDDLPADLSVRGPAEAVYLFVWNRAPADLVAIDGDPRLTSWWRERIRIRWS